MPSQRHLRYTKRSEAFLTLSEAVAHDVNNLLSGILGYSDLLLINPTADSLRSPIEEISNAGKRIASLIRMLSAFGNTYTYHPEILDLNKVILEIEGLIPHMLRKEIEFILFRSPGLWPVRADMVKMKQALITLAALSSAVAASSALRTQSQAYLCFSRNKHVARRKISSSSAIRILAAISSASIIVCCRFFPKGYARPTSVIHDVNPDPPTIGLR